MHSTSPCAVNVFNLRTQEEQSFVGCTVRSAVIAAYAQSKGDQNTWEYETKYGKEIKLANNRTWVLGDFCALDR
jgi:hypothetical protein